MISILCSTKVAVSKGMGARKGREELILSWVIAQPEASRLSKSLMFVCGKQPRPSLQIAHNGDNFIQTKKVSDHREREREHVSPLAMRKPSCTVSGQVGSQSSGMTPPFSSPPNVGTLLFIEVSTSTTTATLFGKFLKVLTITCCRDC